MAAILLASPIGVIVVVTAALAMAATAFTTIFLLTALFLVSFIVTEGNTLVDGVYVV